MTFSHLVTAFFQKYLVAERGLSPNTLASYSDCIRLLITFVCTRLAKQPEALKSEDFNRELIIAFLDDLENTRKNSVSTRNQRLAIIKAFFRFSALNVPELMHLNKTIQAIHQKNTDYTPPPSMTREEVDAILSVPDTSTLIGVRDRALVALLYNSGARAQEVADLRICDVRFEAPATITLTGKGNKTRIIPLWEETAEAFTNYLKRREQAGIHSDHLFLNVKENPITRHGIGRRVEKLAAEAACHCPSLRGRTITPHVFRHTIALHLIEKNVDIFTVRDWLGHADIKTTNLYVEVSIERKRAALAKVPPPTSGEPVEEAQWKQPELMAFLTNLSQSVMLRKPACSGRVEPVPRTCTVNHAT